MTNQKAQRFCLCAESNHVWWAGLHVSDMFQRVSRKYLYGNVLTGPIVYISNVESRVQHQGQINKQQTKWQQRCQVDQ